MSIIKDAFYEGRETEVSWKKSAAKKNDVKMQVAISNIESFAKREKLSGTPISLHRVCPSSGKVLQTYPNRLAAAEWIVKNVTKRTNQNPISVTGNLEMCMRAGWKSYGYYWIMTDTTVGRRRSGFRPVTVNSRGKDFRFITLSAAAGYMKVHRSTLTENLNKYGVYKKGTKTAAYT